MISLQVNFALRMIDRQMDNLTSLIAELGETATCLKTTLKTGGSHKVTVSERVNTSEDTGVLKTKVYGGKQNWV
jgi:hypothetical protein